MDKGNASGLSQFLENILETTIRNFLEHSESPRLQDQAVMLRFMRPVCLVLPPAPGPHLPALFGILGLWDGETSIT